MKQVFTIIMKIFLLLVGGVMLIGGGICAVTNAFFTLKTIPQPGGFFLLYGFLFLISLVIAWYGWQALKVSGITKSKQSTIEPKSVKNDNAEK